MEGFLEIVKVESTCAQHVLVVFIYANHLLSSIGYRLDPKGRVRRIICYFPPASFQETATDASLPLRLSSTVSFAGDMTP